MELVSLILALALTLVSVSANAPRYIVFTDKSAASTYATQAEQNLDILASLDTTDSFATSHTIVHTYEYGVKGFAATITPLQAESLRQVEGVLAVYEDILFDLHTTHTPKFLGLNQKNLWPDHTLKDLYNASHDVIIGVVDTGVWPESMSYSDRNMPPIPERWNGSCQDGHDFDGKTACNKKLIGAYTFVTNDTSPRDNDGHGTHTSSTAGGSRIRNTSFYGYAPGNARGMASGARLATYKVCTRNGCLGSDILRGIDRAISDGVDVLSMSLGGQETEQVGFIAAATYQAALRGIFVSCSAGNSGPVLGSVSNPAAWEMTVGAGTLDRDFPAHVYVTGVKEAYRGASLYYGKGMKGPVELFYGSDLASQMCFDGKLDNSSAKGKIVICDRGITARLSKGLVVNATGAAGMILANSEDSGNELVADAHVLPALAVTYLDGILFKKYAKNQAKAKLVFGGTVMRVKPTPRVAAFSSRGPFLLMPQVLKPDVIAPGLNILASWPGNVSFSSVPEDTRKTNFNIISGTSMSCPHVSGLAALMKAAHPKWSPAMIKSALMTTAYMVDNTNSAIRDLADNTTATPFALGSGHVDLHSALSPGFVYDIKPKEYITFLCSLGVDIQRLRTLNTKATIYCNGNIEKQAQLNYPSFSVIFDNPKAVVEQIRFATNVGLPKSVYKVSVEAPKNVKVTVKPKTLVFNGIGDVQNYTVTFKSKKAVTYSFGSIAWVNGKTRVRSPVAAYW